MKRILRSLSFVFLLIFSGAIYTGNAQEFKVIAKGKSELLLFTNGHRRSIIFRHTIDGYEVRCDMSLMVVWGKPLKFNENNPQDSELSIVDLHSLRTMKTASFSRGIFDVEFLKESPMAIVGTDAGVLIDLTTGEIKPPPQNLEFSSEEFPREICEAFTGKTYRRYTE